MLPLRRLAPMLAAIAAVTVASHAAAFCGFFVGKADTTLYNKASQVILVREGTRTVISMLNDYRGEPSQFALVVPVPQVLERGQIRIGDRRTFERIDGFTAPRLAEYFDPNPCERKEIASRQLAMDAARPASARASARKDKVLGVAVEVRYTVGEYDIVLLSARESDGLETWLLRSGYRIPKGASAALKPYVRQNLKFFVARVNLDLHARTGRTWLSPLQFAFDSEKFMLPVRLGMLNADGPQDLVVYVLTQRGRVETTNYRTVKVPSNAELPVHVRDDFGNVYRALFDEQARREELRAVFTEFFWDMSWCDPCAADPLTPAELREAGVFWVDAPGASAPRTAALPVMVTRLHLRYTRETLPEDLVFQQTADRQNFQARYVLRHAWAGPPDACPDAEPYFTSVRERQEREAATLATLTGWDVNAIRARMTLPATGSSKWWEALWPPTR
jgi:hypothetical protein